MVYWPSSGDQIKPLMFDTNGFWFKTFSKTDEVKKDKVIKRACGHISWLAKKTNRSRVILHFFAHLSESKSSVEFSKEALYAIRDRLI